MNYKQQCNLTDWIAALLSDDFKQGFGKLYRPDTGCHCPLGVAAEVVGEFPRDGYTYSYGLSSDLGLMSSEHAVPSGWFKRAFGLPFGPTQLVDYNDGLGLSFTEIAARLITYLPASTNKAELQKLVVEKLKAQRGQLVDITV